jgi:hypothetical protein
MRLLGVYEGTNKAERKILYLDVEMSDFSPNLWAPTSRNAERKIVLGGKMVAPNGNDTFPFALTACPCRAGAIRSRPISREAGGDNAGLP